MRAPLNRQWHHHHHAAAGGRAGPGPGGGLLRPDGHGGHFCAHWGLPVGAHASALGGGAGGSGGFGFFDKPITQPFSQPYAVGGAAGNTTIANVGTVNAGNAGNNASGPAVQSGNPGNPGTSPGATISLNVNRTNVIGSVSAGGTGHIAVFENIGT